MLSVGGVPFLAGASRQDALHGDPHPAEGGILVASSARFCRGFVGTAFRVS